MGLGLLVENQVILLVLHVIILLYCNCGVELPPHWAVIVKVMKAVVHYIYLPILY